MASIDAGKYNKNSCANVLKNYRTLTPFEMEPNMMSSKKPIVPFSMNLKCPF